MGRKNKILVPEAQDSMNQLKTDVMKNEGYTVNNEHPEDVKYEVADELGIPLKKGYNGNLASKDAGKVGGAIGGKMVSELIKIAKRNL